MIHNPLLNAPSYFWRTSKWTQQQEIKRDNGTFTSGNNGSRYPQSTIHNPKSKRDYLFISSRKPRLGKREKVNRTSLVMKKHKSLNKDATTKHLYLLKHASQCHYHIHIPLSSLEERFISN